MSETSYRLPLAGGCQCGGVRYEITGPPGTLYACHCRECQKLSVSAFSLSLTVRFADFRVTQGEPQLWSRPADTGNTVDCRFCPRCGTRLWHETRGDAEWITVKAGSLDEPVNFAEAIHIWTMRKMPGLVIPDDAVQFPGEPEE